MQILVRNVLYSIRYIFQSIKSFKLILTLKTAPRVYLEPWLIFKMMVLSMFCQS